MELQQLCWCPVMIFPPSPDLPFNVPSSPLAPPKLARPVRWKHLLLHVMGGHFVPLSSRIAWMLLGKNS